MTRKAEFRSGGLICELRRNEWQKRKQTDLRSCAQPGNCPVQPAHETWPARSVHTVLDPHEDRP